MNGERYPTIHTPQCILRLHCCCCVENNSQNVHVRGLFEERTRGTSLQCNVRWSVLHTVAHSSPIPKCSQGIAGQAKLKLTRCTNRTTQAIEQSPVQYQVICDTPSSPIPKCSQGIVTSTGQVKLKFTNYSTCVYIYWKKIIFNINGEEKYLQGTGTIGLLPTII